MAYIDHCHRVSRKLSELYDFCVGRHCNEVITKISSLLIRVLISNPPLVRGMIHRFSGDMPGKIPEKNLDDFLGKYSKELLEEFTKNS